MSSLPEFAEPARRVRRQMAMNASHSPYHLTSFDRLAAGLTMAGAAIMLAATVTTAADATVRTGQAPDACWTDAPGTLGAIEHPTEPSAIVLRLFTGGGFVPLEIAFMENPVFTLYGNNVAIFRPADEMTDITEPMAPYLCSRLSPEQVDDLLAFALDEGGLRDAASFYEDPFIVDTPNTTFTVDADGVSKDVLVQALGFNPEAPDPEARARFEALADLLTDFAPEVETSQPFDVPLYRGLLTEVWVESPATPVAWPWGDLSPDDFTGEGFPTALLTSEQVSAVAAIPNGGQGYIVLELPDGSLRSLAIAPLLPDHLAAAVAA